jgi:exonuclease SbcC
MRISFLELKNYRRFRSLKIQFPDGIIGILGLNGVGKSTIIEAIAWALFGNVDEVVRTGKDSIRRTGVPSTDTCAVTLEFELGGTEYKVHREMGGKSLGMKAELRTKDKVLAEDDKPVKRMVEKLIGMDHKSFFTSVFAIQKELNALQNIAAGERKKVVLRMLRIDGLDAILTNIRADKNSSISRVQGAEKTLIDVDGRDREQVLRERLPALVTAREEASKRLEDSERLEHQAMVEVDALRARRDELKKDVDAYFSTASDLKGRQSAHEELKKRERSIDARIIETNTSLQRLPDLERQEKDWGAIGTRKEALEGEKVKSERARMIRSEISADQADETRILEELQNLRTSLGSAEDLHKRIEDTEKARAECQNARSEISGRIGGLKAQIAERRDAGSKDSIKLEEIRLAGKDGICPTCERTLEDSYELLVTKLEESSRSAEKAASEAASAIASLESELVALTNKEEALKKRRTSLDKDMQRLKQQETSLEAKEGELAKLRGKISQRKLELQQYTDVKYSDQEYAKVVNEYSRLKSLHEEYVELKSLKSQSEHYHRDLGDVRERMKKIETEEVLLKSMVTQLEPKKTLHESTVKDLDRKTVTLNSAKDAVRKLSSAKDKSESEHDKTRKDLEDIERVKRSIEEDRRTGDDLALLEEVVVNFKDHLIGRIVPALSELTSKGLESMSGGRYPRVELSDDYEMKIEDQGVMYPVDRFSGGEADLANLSLRLAISRIIADRTGANPINFLILDEIFGSQDPSRKRSVIAALSRLSSQFRQIFLITHIEDIKDLMNNVIRVEESEDGTSVAELAS